MGKAETRQYNLDILKAVAIIAMVICHPVSRLGSYIPGYEEDFWYFLGEDFFGSYVFVAHGFMFALGVGMIYTRNGDPSSMIRRGIKLYLMGYIFNFVRYGIYIIIADVVTGDIIAETWEALFSIGILHFAGLAFILTAILKALRLTEVQILVISIVLSAIGSFIPYLDTGNPILDYLVGHFVSTNYLSSFVLFNWYICVAFGRLIGSALHNTRDKDRLYKKMLFISGGIMAIYVVLTARFGVYFLSMNREYYAASTLEMMGLLSIDVFGLSVFYFILQKAEVSRFKILIEKSMNITAIYFIHWMILGPTEVIFCYMLGYTFTYPQIYLYAAVLLPVSTYAAARWRSRKHRVKSGLI